MDARQRLEAFTKDLSNLKDACDYIANGGSLITLCKQKDVQYSSVINWIYDSDERKAMYEKALEARGEWVAQRVLSELNSTAFVDIRNIFNDDGSIKDISEIDDDTARAINGIEVFEEFEGFGKDREHVGQTKKIKLVDKLKSIEMLGKNLKMFTDKKEFSGTLTLEDLINKSMSEVDSDAKEETTSEEF